MAGGDLQIDDVAALGAALGEHLLQNWIERLRQRRQARDLPLFDRGLWRLLLILFLLLRAQRAARHQRCNGRAEHQPLPHVTFLSLLATDAGLPDDRPPFVDLGRREGAERLGRLLFARDDIETEIVAAACSLAPGDVETGNHRPCIASCGIPLAFAEVKTRAALANARPRTEVFTEHLPAERITGILLYVHDRRGGFDLQVRMFAPLYGVPEDPATGSGNVALAGLLACLRAEPDLSLKFRIGQGIDMGRPSLLEAGAEKRGGEIVGLSIGGRCVPMMRGVLEV